MKPIAYTQTEGSNWLPWIYGDVSELFMNQAYDTLRMPIDDGANSVLVHSLKFKNGIEWDSINGFRV